MLATWWPAALVGGGLLVAYAILLATRPATRPTWSPWRTAAWVAGCVVTASALAPDLTAQAHHDHRSHMAQHLLLGMYAPLGLVLGAPVTLLLGSLSPRGARRVSTFLRLPVVHVVSHPVTAAVLSVGGLFVLYLTPLLTASAGHPLATGLVLAHFLLAGCLYTWAVAGPDPAPRRPRMRTRLVVLVLAAGAHAFLAKLLYALAAGGHAGHGDPGSMLLAAQLMYYGGDLAEVALAVMLFGEWLRKRRRQPVAVGTTAG